ncbi:MAG: hypothetical protein WAL71_02900 [Terriglobales bacterium]
MALTLEDLQHQLNVVSGTLKALEARVAELSRAPAAGPEAVHAAAKEATHGKIENKIENEVTPDILVVIAAAVTAFLGKNVRIRSAKVLQSPYEIINPWSQQGRVFVQASHNLRSRG